MAGEFSSPESTLCADSYLALVSPPCYCSGPWRDPSQSAKSAGDRLYRNMHKPLIQRSQSGLTGLFRHGVETSWQSNQALSHVTLWSYTSVTCLLCLINLCHMWQWDSILVSPVCYDSLIRLCCMWQCGHILVSPVCYVRSTFVACDSEVIFWHHLSVMSDQIVACDSLVMTSIHLSAVSDQPPSHVTVRWYSSVTCLLCLINLCHMWQCDRILVSPVCYVWSTSVIRVTCLLQEWLVWSCSSVTCLV